MTPEALAALHGAAFDEGWSAAAFADLIASPGAVLLTAPQAFLLARVIAPEAEVLTLAVAPGARRQGAALGLVRQLQDRRDVTHIFLEVAADNHAARALYTRTGFERVGLRRAYYSRAGGAVDAVMMRWALAPAPTASGGGIG